MDIQQFLDRASGWVWGGEIWDDQQFFGILVPLLLGTGLYLTWRLRGLQFWTLGRALKLGLITRKEKGDATGDVSHYQALSTALAATVGVGNIAGVAGAIHLGGPGAIFWMWITGLLGMATKYTEAFLGVKYRRTDEAGEQSGGPQFYLNQIKGRIGPILGVTFAIFAILASFGIGNMTQANAVASTADGSWGVPLWVTGLILTVLAAVVVIGGIKSIGKVTAAFVPIMIVIYLAAGTWVLLANLGELGSAFGTIFSDAFSGTALAGGFAGALFIHALRYGVARGIFSNESGLGTGGIAAAAAKTTHATRQALVSMTQTFIDTIVVVTFTGLVIVVTGAYEMGTPKAVDADAWSDFGGAPMTQLAFNDGLPGDWGDDLVALSVAFFAFSTLLGWCYYGERNVERLLGRRAFGRVGPFPVGRFGQVGPYPFDFVFIYRLIFVVVVFVGATSALKPVWTFSDVMNGLMALPNLIGLLILAGMVARETREYLKTPDGMALKRG
jgi:AGCS family alanine or glycine:cation symporter